MKYVVVFSFNQDKTDDSRIFKILLTFWPNKEMTTEFCKNVSGIFDQNSARTMNQKILGKFGNGILVTADFSN
jgi:hypothetical protein